MTVPEPPDYRNIVSSRLKANVAAVPGLLEDNDSALLKKIATFAQKYGFDEKDVAALVRHIPAFAAHFALDPLKQNVCEIAAAEYLESLPLVEGFANLVNGGDEAIVLRSSGSLARMGDIQEDEAISKSVDFAWWCGPFRFYAFHKYTNEGGGNQDNQHADLKRFIEFAPSRLTVRKVLPVQAGPPAEAPSVFLAIADGAYYEASVRRGADKTKMDALREDASGEARYACRIGEVPGIIESILLQYGETYGWTETNPVEPPLLG